MDRKTPYTPATSSISQMKKSLGRWVTFHDTSTPAMKMMALSRTRGVVMPEMPRV